MARYVRLLTNLTSASRCRLTFAVALNNWKNNVPRGVSAIAAMSD
jgi:hypothetical protein